MDVVGLFQENRLQIIIAALVGLLLLGVAFIFVSNGSAGRSRSHPTFLLVGPSYSGKTSLFSRWTTGTIPATVTSQTPNKFDKLQIPFDSDDPINSQFTLIDLPGNAKLWHMTIDELNSSRINLKGIIFLIDAASGTKNIAEAAKQLYKLLQLTEKQDGGMDILIAANKADVFNVISTTRIRGILEKEIHGLRDSQSKGISDVNEEDNESSAWIGTDGPFQFNHLEGDVMIVDGSVRANRTQKWQEWVERHALN